MSQRVPASARTREALSSLIEGRLSSEAGLSELVRLATRLIIEEGLEGEVRDALGREYYERGAAPGHGYRNGVRTGRVKTAEGVVEYGAPQVAGREEPFRSELREHLKGHSEALEDLALEMLARGLSVRDPRSGSGAGYRGCLQGRDRPAAAVADRGRRDRQAALGGLSAFKSRDPAEYDIAICSSMGSPSGSAQVSGASRSWPPGASPSTAARCSST